jgi:DUF1680 family protein
MTTAVQDAFIPASRGNTKIEGHLGRRLDTCIRNGVMAADYSLYLVPFRDQTDDGGSWGGEFWGKWYTSATLAYAYQPTAEHKDVLVKAAEGLIATQQPNGRLSSSKKNFADWDIWGRKYALLGLVGYYDQTGDIRGLEAAARALDDLISVTGPGETKLTETGLSLLEALSSCSILEPVVLIYKRTNEKKYLEFAEYLVSLWSESNRFNPSGIRLIEDALAGVKPLYIASPKGYEMMSCYEGLCELYRVTGNRMYLDAVLTFANQVRLRETMIVGSGSSGELWCDGTFRQTELLEQPMETCVTTTWIKLCSQLLRMTGDSVWADEMEITLYNAMLGAMVQDGNWWSYFSPLMGERVPSHMQVPLVQCSCCTASGPRGLLTAPGWAVMTSASGLAVNLYFQGSWSGTVHNTHVELACTTHYPQEDSVQIKVHASQTAHYTIQLRVPAWSKQTTIQVNGQTVDCTPGTYASITREWKDGDTITMKLDLRGRVLTAPGSVNQKAIMRGPIVLALDSRLLREDHENHVNLWLDHEGLNWRYNQDWKIDYLLLHSTDDLQETYIDLIPVKDKPAHVWMAFEVPFTAKPTHFIGHNRTKLIMCDYASAGNEFTEDNRFRVWLPQPLFMKQAFPEQTWKLLVMSENRPTIPPMRNV